MIEPDKISPEIGLLITQPSYFSGGKEDPLLQGGQKVTPANQPPNSSGRGLSLFRTQAS